MPSSQERPPVRMTAGRWGAGLSASTGSRRRHGQWDPDLIYDNHRSSRRRAPRRATTSPRTWPTGRSSSSPTPSRSIPTSRSSALLHGAMHAPTTCPRMGGPLPGRVRRRLDAYREKVFARQKELGSSPARRALPSRPRRPRVGFAQRRSATLVRADDGGLRRLLTHTDHHIGRLLDLLEDFGGIETRWSWRCPTTARAPRAVRTARRTRTVLQQCPRAVGGQPRAMDSSAARERFNHYRGLGHSRGTRSFRALEAREPARATATVHRRLAAEDHWPAEGAPRRFPPHHRHDPDHARRARGRAAGVDPGVTQSPLSRSASRTPSGREGAKLHGSRSSRCSATGRSITTVGARCARGRARRWRGGPGIRGADLGRSSRSSTPRVANSATWPRMPLMPTT